MWGQLWGYRAGQRYRPLMLHKRIQNCSHFYSTSLGIDNKIQEERPYSHQGGPWSWVQVCLDSITELVESWWLSPWPATPFFVT